MAVQENSTPTTFNFIQRQGRSEKLIVEVEIVFGEGAPGSAALFGGEERPGNRRLTGLCS
jgi:hypothetical protein